jgi:predicted NBD/HSP70 family sugar kinase
MSFYTKQHKYYCGIDLHARKMYVCILDQAGKVLAHKKIHIDPERFLKVISSYRENIVVATECIFTWCWLADLGASKIGMIN